MGISRAVDLFFQLVVLLLVISVLLTWLPNIDWYKEPFRSLRSFSDLILEPFKKVIPPIGMIDISPIIALMALSFLREIIVSLLRSIGV